MESVDSTGASFSKDVLSNFGWDDEENTFGMNASRSTLLESIDSYVGEVTVQPVRSFDIATSDENEIHKALLEDGVVEISKLFPETALLWKRESEKALNIAESIHWEGGIRID